MQFYGEGNPPLDEIILKNYLERVDGGKNGFYVECGAFDGLGASCSKMLEEQMGWRGINIEASLVEYPKLIQNRRNSISMNFALAATDGTVEFIEVTPTRGIEGIGNSSMSHGEAHKKELLEKGCSFSTRRIPSISWDTLSNWFPATGVDLLVLDIEGHEVEVLKAMTKRLPSIICVEYVYAGIENIARALLPKGYTFDFLAHASAFFSRNEIAKVKRPAFGETGPVVWNGTGWVQQP